ncbi:hypothetical protein CMK11_16935 [Candidatus Poribacteria bacterium]|nr:hypothetical protein [Candidatus Poribacteria bacterium]
MIFPGHDRAGVLVDFARLVRGDAPFPTDGRNELPNLAVIFAAIQSAAENRIAAIDEIIEA